MPADTYERLRQDNELLRRQLAEAQETIRAIKRGEVDAVVTIDAAEPQVLTLDPPDRPYRLLVQRMHQGAATLTVDGVILHCNEHFSRLLGHPVELLLGRPVDDFVDDDSAQRFRALLDEGLSTSVKGRVVLRHSDGSPVAVCLGVSSLCEGTAGVCLIIADLTDQEHRERLIADEALARAILDQVAEAVIVCDAGGRVLRASPAARGLCGTEPLMQPFAQVFRLEDADGCPVDLSAAWRGETLRSREVALIRPDGSRAELLLGTGPLVSADGEVRGAVFTLTDITSQRAAERELRRRAAELQETDRHKDEFLAMLAHELRNPLSPIRSSLEIMHLKELDDPHLRKCRDIIGRQVQQLTRLVDDLLEVSRISTGKIQLQLERFDLATAVARAVETSRPLLDAKGHHLSVSLPEAPVWVRADLTRIAQVVGNLLNNAAKYTEHGGRIEVQVRREGVEASVRVRDDGAGIPTDMLQKVFGLFIQIDRSLDRSQGGLGIGLALVRRLVTMHGGRVEAVSEGAGRGSEFVVRLPVWNEDRVESSAPAPRAGHAGSRRVLVVDDNQDARDSMATLLGMLGHDVRTAADGSSALTVAADFRPEVVLCDIGLPLMDGYEVVARLRPTPGLTATRFIAVTGYGREQDARRSLAAGFHDHLVKPVDITKLESALSFAE